MSQERGSATRPSALAQIVVYQAVLNNAVSSPAEAHLISLTGRR